MQRASRKPLEVVDRFPGGWRQTPTPECGCSPWRPAVDMGGAQHKSSTLSQNVEAQVGQQEMMA